MELNNPIVIAGGVLVDDIAIPPENLRPGSSNPVSWEQKLGGVAANVACIVARQSPAVFIGCIGSDSYGKAITAQLNERAVQTCMVVASDKTSDRYTAVLDKNGELHIGLAAVTLAEQLNWQSIKTHLLQFAPQCIALDANLSQSCLTESVRALRAQYGTSKMLIGLAVSPHKVVRWQPVLSELSILFCNRQEAAALSQMSPASAIDELADALVSMCAQQFVITDGSNSIVVQDKNDRAYVTVPACKSKVTVNGAGDALAGATIAHLARGHALANAVTVAGLPAAHAVLSGAHRPPTL